MRLRGRSEVFFPSFLRNQILSAGRALTLLRIHYGGATRLVEPYSLVFRILKDGIAREYLCVHDHSGSDRNPKSFRPDRETWAENTSEQFQPRYEMEISKAGGVEMIRQFKPKPLPRPGPKMLRRFGRRPRRR